MIAEYESLRPSIGQADAYPLARLPKFSQFIVRKADDDQHGEGFGVVTEAIRALRRTIRHDLRRSAGRSPTGAAHAIRDEDLEGRYRDAAEMRSAG